MRIAWLGLVGVWALMTSCGGDPQNPPPPPPPDPPKFRVGGTISGLSGSLTLQLNGAESLTRTDNGPFTFQSQLEDQSNFTVALTTPPVEQDCTLQDATGKVNGTDVTSVKVSCVQRTYSLGGSVEGLTGTLQLRLGDEVLPVTANGPFTFQTRLPKDGMYAVTVEAQPQGQRCVVTGSSGTVAGNVTGIAVRCDLWFTLTHFQVATRVLGQSNFTSNAPHQGGTPNANTLDGPWGNPVLAGGRLYVSDLLSNRILGFDWLPPQANASATFALGQPDSTSTTSGSTQSSFASPAGGSSDGTRLAVADKSNNRVLLYTTLPAAGGTQPDLVIGQPTFDSTDPRCDDRTVNAPHDVFLGHGRLIVADTFNHRILVWNTIPTQDEAPADLVLGQTSFTHCVRNDANGDGTVDANPTASTLSFPGGVWTDGKRLVVADTANNRVLLWNTFPTTHGQPADVVLGQPNSTSRAPATTSTGLSSPQLVASTGVQLFVADHENHRVLVWNHFPTTDGAEANTVLGQPNFTTQNMADPPGGTSPSSRSLLQPSGVLLSWPYVVVAEYGNNRLLFFESQ